MKAVYTLEDLRRIDPTESKPIRLAVLGQPIAHSASPIMHQAALDACGIAARYIRLEVPPGELATAFNLMQEKNFIGCNVTVPHKLEALATCTNISEEALLLGAVNTVRFIDQQAQGFNTDGPGFVSALTSLIKDSSLISKSILILGAGGGAGQAIATQCAISGFQHILLVNRSVEKLTPLAKKLSSISPSSQLSILSFQDESLTEICHRSDIIVNATSMGLHPEDPLLLTPHCLHEGQVVYDTIYKPAITPLLAMAQQLNCKTENGFSMLLHQGALAFKMWFPDTEPLEIMQSALSHLR